MSRNNLIAIIIFCIGITIGYEYGHTESPKLCFTPGQNCTKFIINEIDKASSSIYMQAYGFTDKDIAQSLVNAKKRGVDVRLILDKSNLTSNYSRLADIKLANIKYHIDKVPGIAHNKVIILDKSKVLTGSYNYTAAANNRNSENIILIDNRAVAESYYQNWLRRAYE